MNRSDDPTNVEIEIEGSSGNVFADLGFDNPDEELLKAQLAHLIGRLLGERGDTQQRIAALLRTTQPKVSLLLRGRTELFSVQKLFDFLNLLDQDVFVTIRPKRGAHAYGRTALAPAAAAERAAKAVRRAVVCAKPTVAKATIRAGRRV